jgi:hypothetical protein
MNEKENDVILEEDELSMYEREIEVSKCLNFFF